MKKYLSLHVRLLLVAMLLWGCHQHNHSEKNVHELQKFVYRSPNGDSILSGYTCNNKFHNKLEISDFQNTKCEEIVFKMGIMDGPYKSYLCTPDQRFLEVSGFYKNNQKDSIWITYSKTSDTSSLITYNHGEKSGYSFKKFPLLKSQVSSFWTKDSLTSSTLLNLNTNSIINLAVNGTGLFIDMPFLFEKEYVLYKYKGGVRDGEMRTINLTGDTLTYGQYKNNEMEGTFVYINPIASINSLFIPTKILSLFKEAVEDNLTPHMIKGEYKEDKPISRWEIYDEKNYLIKVININSNDEYEVSPPEGIIKYGGHRSI